MMMMHVILDYCAIFTSIEVGVRQVGLQEHGLAGLQLHPVQEVDDEAAAVTRELGVEAQEQVSQQRGCGGRSEQSEWSPPADVKGGVRNTMHFNPNTVQSPALAPGLLIEHHLVSGLV